jgi:uncharacterized protein (TIGR00369 family)
MNQLDPEALNRLMMAQGGAPFFQAVGAEIVESEPGRSLMRLPYSPFIVGNPDTGVVHGGVITGMLDHACGMAVGSKLGALSSTPGAMRSIATLDLRIDYMKAAKPDAEIFILGECVKVTRQIVFARGRAYQDADDTVATATAAFIITDMKG